MGKQPLGLGNKFQSGETMTVLVKPLQVKTRDGRHTAAYIVGSVFRKQLHQENKLQSPPGWTLENEFIIEGRYVKLAELKRYGITTIQIHVLEAPGSLYVASLQSFRDNGLEVDRGTGLHVALADPFWKTINFYKLW